MEEDPSKEVFDEQPPPLYETLGLEKDASEQQIRTAYRRRALLSHPDKLPSSLSEEEREKEGLKFRKVRCVVRQ
jgi:curved DNA-binding protein CbpA